MKTLSEDSMVCIEGGGIEALVTKECVACGAAIAACAGAAYVISQYGLAAVIGAIMGYGEQGVRAAMAAVTLVGEGLSQCGACWEMLKE